MARIFSKEIIYKDTILPTKTHSDIQKKTLKGVGWSVASKLFRQFIQLFFQIALARLLSPEDFGLFGMIIVFINLAEVVRNLGFGQALIQKNELSDAYLNTVFWLNVGVALIVFIVFYFCAPLIADFYRAPELKNITRVYSFIFVIGSLNIVQESLLQKNLEFKRLFLMDGIAVTVAGTAAILMATHNGGVYTLVIQYLVLAATSTCILWATSSWKPKIQFCWKAYHDLKHFSFNLLGNDLLNLLSRNIDHLLIGRYLGAALLGIYARAYFFMLQPINLTHQVLARVMFPVLSTYKDDYPKMKKIYLLSTRLIAFSVFPAFTYIMVTAKPLIVLLLGAQWVEVAYILQIFCVYSIADTIGLSTVWIYKASGNTQKLFKWKIYSTSVTVFAIIIGLNWGIYGIAWAYVLSFYVFLFIPGWIIAFRIIHLPLKEMMDNISGSFITALFTAILLLLSYYYLLNRSTPVTLCIVLLAQCMATYFSLSALMNRNTLMLFYEKILSKILPKKINLA